MMQVGEIAPLVSPVQGRRLNKWPALVVGLCFACVCLVVKSSLASGALPTSMLSKPDPRMGGVDGLGILGARRELDVPASAQQLAVDAMADVRERANGPLGYVPKQAQRGSIWSGLDDSVGRLPGVNVDAWGAMKLHDGVETPAMMRRAARLQQYHTAQAGGALSRLPSESEPDVLERVVERPVAAPAVEVPSPMEQGVLARAPVTDEGDGLLGRVVAAPHLENREAGGVLMQTGDDRETAEGALAQTGEDDTAAEGVLSHDFGLDAENTGGSLFMQSVHPDEGWMQSGKDDGWASAVHDNSWKLDTSRTAGGSLALVKGDDMAQGALSSLTAQKLQTHAAGKAVVHKLHGGEDVTGSLSVSPAEHAKELVDGSLAASHAAFGHEGSLSRVKTIDEIQAEKAAEHRGEAAEKATESVHKIKGGEDVKGSLSVSPTVDGKELVDGSLAATQRMSAGKAVAHEGEGKKVVAETTMAARIVHKLQEASAVARRMTHVTDERQSKVKASVATAHAKTAAAHSGAEVAAEEKDLQHLVKHTMAQIKKNAGQAVHVQAQSKLAHAKHADATGVSVATKPKITLQAKKGFDIFPKEHKMNLLNETDGGDENEVDLGESWDDVGWVKHRWTLTTWVSFVLAAPVFTILVTALVGHTSGFVAALCTFIILVCMDIACYYYSWFLF